MPGCVFHAYGSDFAVDEFLVGSSLKPYSIYHRGEVRPHHNGERCWDHSGFKVNVSDVDGDLPREIDEAIAFLMSHQAELTRLARCDGVEGRYLDFGYDRRDVALQIDYLPPELLLLAGSMNIGIKLSLDW